MPISQPIGWPRATIAPISMNSTFDTSRAPEAEHAEGGELAGALGELDAGAVVDDAEGDDDAERHIDAEHDVDVLAHRLPEALARDGLQGDRADLRRLLERP